jgi:hypothetical protein
LMITIHFLRKLEYFLIENKIIFWHIFLRAISYFVEETQHG